VDPAQVLAWAQQLYGPMAARPVPARKAQTEPAQTGQRRLEVKAAAEQPYLTLAYAAPRLSDPDAADPASQDALALIMLAAVLDGYDGARLGRQLVQRAAGERLADSAGAGYSGLGRGPAQFYLDGTPAPGQTPDAVATALQAEVARVARDGVQDAELQRVKNQWRAAEVYKLDALFAQARELGSQWINGWRPDASEHLMESLRRVTPAQVQSVAQRYFGPDQLTQAVLLPDAQALAQRQQAAASRPKLDLRH
jgi:zinc protease